jgi:hypothetical protein
MDMPTAQPVDLSPESDVLETETDDVFVQIDIRLLQKPITLPDVLQFPGGSSYVLPDVVERSLAAMDVRIDVHILPFPPSLLSAFK